MIEAVASAECLDAGPRLHKFLNFVQRPREELFVRTIFKVPGPVPEFGVGRPPEQRSEEMGCHRGGAELQECSLIHRVSSLFQSLVIKMSREVSTTDMRNRGPGENGRPAANCPPLRLGSQGLTGLIS